MNFFLLPILLGCSKEAPQSPQKSEVKIQEVPYVSSHSEGENPVFLIENIQEKHLEMMLAAYKELETYYDGVLSTDVKKIRFVGKPSPWKPTTDGQYCIDTLSSTSTKTEHIYYFANYCRSLSTLLRETNHILYSYINIQTCEDLCSCVMEKGLRVRTTINKKNVSCITYCKSIGWENTCTQGNVNTKCCAQ